MSASAATTALKAHLNGLQPPIPFVTNESTSYDEVRKAYLSTEAEPQLITRPQSAEDVAALVSYCVSQDLEVCVRGGGHDITGRSIVHGAVVIDMRDINHVTVNADKKSAQIGGGVLNDKVLAELEKHGLVTPTGTECPVGYTGWGTLGGYGFCGPSFGLGLDQIRGARLVNAQGQIVDADEDMLKCIRGASGNLGVIVEMTIKVYPLREMHFGNIVYASPDSVHDWFNAFDKMTKETPLPSNFYIIPGVLNIPGIGRTFMALMFWHGPDGEEVQRWRSKFSNLAPVAKSEMTKSTPLGVATMMTQMLPMNVYGQTATVSLSHYSAEATSIIAKHVDKMPECPGIMLAIHSIWGEGCNNTNHLSSVWRHGEPHMMLEIVGMPVVKDFEEAAVAWAEDFRKELATADSALEGCYVSMSSRKVDPKLVYGDEFEFLMGMKEKYDPNRVFKHAAPSL
ncbi:FAD-binding domain-containing protein [Thozetella sp. PMI_491]|nr:FAD-binding domain-containing protein [Thozetella sp. PMI_491]